LYAFRWQSVRSSFIAVIAALQDTAQLP